MSIIIDKVTEKLKRKRRKTMSNAIKYQSLSEEGKEIVRQFIEDGKEYERKELVAVIKEQAERKEEMTTGIIAGVIKMLTASNEIMVVSRGRYRKGVPMNNQTIQDKVMVLFNKFKGDLDKMCMVNALNLKEEDIEFIRRLNEVCNNLEAFIWELEDISKETAVDERKNGLIEKKAKEIGKETPAVKVEKTEKKEKK